MNWNDNTNSNDGISYKGQTIFHFSDDTILEQGIYTSEEIRKDTNKLFAINYNKVLFDESFIREFDFDIAWSLLNIRQKLSIDFIREFTKKTDSDVDFHFWNWIAGHFPITEKFVDEFKDVLPWEVVISHHRVSEHFIRKYSDRLNWATICRFQHLSEDFMREFKDKVHWINAVKFQNLSEKFLDEMEKYITKYECWDDVALYQKVNIHFLAKHGLRRELSLLWDELYKANKIDNDSCMYEDRIKDLTNDGFVVLK